MSNQYDMKKVKRLRDAVFEANRFITKAQLAADQIEQGEVFGATHLEYAAAKRSSMDLTRALSELRKSLYGR
ncbi:MAG: hypothetical protein IPM41_16010 [Sphingomonadales bacterium]|nr:hypothetical protein [Sphingomonadales bacterium]